LDWFYEDLDRSFFDVAAMLELGLYNQNACSTE